ncbi:MAG: FAD-dependent oxidoreductase [Elusimicrobia bacterium]|nr:FAD-dependent oxidoreductase [Elusimicrobiota bacterium]
MIRLQQLRLPVGHTEDDLRRAAATALGIPAPEIRSLRVHRQGVDARHPRQIYFIYSLDLEAADEAAVLSQNRPHVSAAADAPYSFSAHADAFPRRPVIVGTGPAGLFAGLLLARAGARPIFLERGRPIEERVKDVEGLLSGGLLKPESNIQFGEGGAGTFSDGKLNSSISDPRCRWVLEQLVAAGAPPDILYKAKPHVGTDRIRETVKRMRRDIQDRGGEFRFGAKVTDLTVVDGRVSGLRVNDGEVVACDAVVLAVGNAARDTFELLHRRGVRLEAKPFSIGARVEHPREWVDRGLYGSFAGHPQLGAADYKMAHHGAKGQSAYTFCMCPGGVVVPGASEEGGVVTNGMSEYARGAPNSNSALMVGVGPAEFGRGDPLAGVAFQREWERRAFALGGGGYKAPVQRVGDFLARRPTTRLGAVSPSYLPGVTPANLWDCLPEFVCEGIIEGLAEFNRRMKGFAHPDALLTGVETRSSSPVRMTRDDSFQTNLRGLFPAGEGAGYAGGIMSSAVDGLRVAEAILATAGAASPRGPR